MILLIYLIVYMSVFMSYFVREFFTVKGRGGIEKTRLVDIDGECQTKLTFYYFPFWTEET